MITPETTMGSIMDQIPGARRALFARYHLGGCQSCGFSPDETLASLCARNGEIDPTEMIEHLIAAHEHDQAVLLSPSEVKDRLHREHPPVLLDCRTREEHQAVTIPQSLFLTQELQQQLFSQDPQQEIILFDHQGKHALDTCAWFLGHGMKNTCVMRGGIDAWSCEVDPSLPRYQLEIPT
ncbi:MAG: rhodanese-like domain-containing protein [Akkermansiaceae bacterium]